MRTKVTNRSGVYLTFVFFPSSPSGFHSPHKKQSVKLSFLLESHVLNKKKGVLEWEIIFDRRAAQRVNIWCLEVIVN